MAEQDRNILKSYFETGDRPTQAQFEDLIDSAINKPDDGISINGNIIVISKDLEVTGNIYTTLDSGSTLTLFESGGEGDPYNGNRIILGADDDGAYIQSGFDTGDRDVITFRNIGGNPNVRIDTNAGALAVGDGASTSGDRSLAVGNGTQATATDAVALGSNTTAGGMHSLAAGENTEATGTGATALGRDTIAQGDLSLAAGDTTQATAESSTALGFSSSADGLRSLAAGLSAQATGNDSTALGNGTQANAYASMALGQYNTGGGDAVNWNNGDPLFEIGNGSSSAARSNAVTVLKNGNVGIGTNTPNYLLHLNTDSAAKPGGGTWADAASDSRLKKDIEAFTDGLEAIKQIEPVWYRYNGKAGLPTDKKYVGVIAQEMQKVASYTVGSFTHKDTEGNETEYLNYDGSATIYMLINAIKELEERLAKLENRKRKK